MTTPQRFIYSVADPGFPVGGAPTLWGGGASTPEAAKFLKICMSKRKNLDPWGGGAGGAPGSANDISCIFTIQSSLLCKI